MYNLTDISTIKRLMHDGETDFRKSLGQNFLIDDDVCPRMAQLCGADKNSGVLEIGPGVGVLTAELCKFAGKVVALEIDKTLLPILEKTLADFDNVKVINTDVMKTDLKRLVDEEFGDMPVYVCANLPYYITSPIIMQLLEERPGVTAITVMVQKEAAERLCAPIGSRESGAVTVAAEFYADRQELFDVMRDSFYPAPKVDSRVIQLVPHKENKYPIKNEKLFFSVIKAGFGKRRKTLLNALGDLPFSKEIIKTAMQECGIPETARIESLDMNALISLCENLDIKNK